MSGWIKLHRKITEWEWYGDANTFRVFMHLLLTANYEDKQWRNIDVKRGQIITGRMELAQTLSLSERQIRTALDKLKMSGVIAIKATNQYSLIFLFCMDGTLSIRILQLSPTQNIMRMNNIFISFTF